MRPESKNKNTGKQVKSSKFASRVKKINVTDQLQQDPMEKKERKFQSPMEKKEREFQSSIDRIERDVRSEMSLSDREIKTAMNYAVREIKNVMDDKKIKLDWCKINRFIEDEVKEIKINNNNIIFDWAVPNKNKRLDNKIYKPPPRILPPSSRVSPPSRILPSSSSRVSPPPPRILPSSPPPRRKTVLIDPSVRDTETKIDEEACVVCMTNSKIIAFGCGHKQTCAECSRRLIAENKLCPTCRKEITLAVRIY